MKKLILITLIVTAFMSCSKDDPEPVKSIDISITSHEKDNIIFNNDKLTFSADIKAENTIISKVEFFLNDEILGTVFSSPFTIEKTFKDYNPGNYILTVLAISNNNQQQKEELQLTLKIRFKDKFKGGTVFKVDENGEHGLIVAPEDLQGGVLGKYKYGAYNGNYGATSLDDGEYNTDKFKGKIDFDYAAIACLNYEHEGYDDWYLPAINEMNLLKENRDIIGIGERQSVIYWSSTEVNDKGAYSVSFGGLIGQPDDKQKYYRVRPIRKF